MAGVDVRGQQWAVRVQSERVARMIAWLAANQETVDGIDKGQLNFSFAGSTGLTAEVVSKADLSHVLV